MKKETQTSLYSVPVEDRLFVLQMAAKIINLNSSSSDEKIGAGNPLAEASKMIAASVDKAMIAESGKELIALNSTTEIVATFDNVLIKAPAQPNVSPNRFILAYSPDLHNVNALEIPNHLYFGYVMKRKDDGKVKPTVTIHFYGLPEEKFGKTFFANIAIKLQTNVLTEEKKMVIDATFNPEARGNDYVMVMDVVPAYFSNEFIIPEMPEKCIRIKPILRKKQYLNPIDIAPIANVRETANV